VNTEPVSTIDPAVQSLLAERRCRLDSDKRRKDAAEKAERVAKAHARHEAMLVAPESAQAKQAKYAHETKEKLRQEKLEKERILKKIAADRTARKEHEDQRKTVAALENRRVAAGALASGKSITLVFKSSSTLLL
jgi:hypothetical protein